MRVSMDASGVITISPDTGAEAFALEMWASQALVNVPYDDPGAPLSPTKATRAYWDMRRLIINANLPKDLTCP